MEKETYPEYSTEYPLTIKSIMERPAEYYPDKTGVVYRDPEDGEYMRFSYEEWYERTCQLANMLEELGADPEDEPYESGNIISTMLLNNHWHHELYYAVPCKGMTLHLINIRLAPDQIQWTINHAEDDILFVEDRVFPILEGIYDDIKDQVGEFVYVSKEEELPDTEVEPLYSYEKLLGKQDKDFDWPYLNENTWATLCYTTGTTGRPKGCMFTHRQLFLHTVFSELGYAWNPDPESAEVSQDEVRLSITPYYHIHGWGYPYNNTFSARKNTLIGQFTPEGFYDAVETEKVTSVSMVPTVLSMILEYENRDEYDISSLKSVGTGGAPLPEGLKKKAEEEIPGFTVSQGWGMTETCPAGSAAMLKEKMLDLPKERKDHYRNKTGLPWPPLELEVVDEEDNPVSRDEETIGEMVLRGPWIFKEYYKDPEKTKEAWRNGLFHTGDLATIDEEGYVMIQDRADDVIQSGAEMVPTVRLENLLSLHEKVLEAAFVGVPDEKWGQRPLALVQPVSGEELSEEEVLDYLQAEGLEKGEISKWMLPDYVAIVEEIPMTSVGKYDKVEIAERLEEFLDKAERVYKPGD